MNWITKFLKPKIKSIFKKKASENDDALWTTCSCKNLILKLGDRGVFCSTHSDDPKSTHFSIESFVNANLAKSLLSGETTLHWGT